MIEYIFTDKTGTLTQNLMNFMYCYAGYEGYGKLNSYDTFENNNDLLGSV